MSAARQSVRWTAVGNVLRSLIATVQLLVIARLVSVPEFGLIILVTSLMLLAQNISDAGLSTALIRFRDVTDEEKSSLFWLNALVGLVMAALTNVAAGPLADFYKAPLLAPMLRIASVIFVAQGLFLQIRVLAERDLRFGAVVSVEVISSVLGFIVAMVLALRGVGAFSVVWAQVVTSLSLLVMNWLVLAREWRPAFRFRPREVARFMPYGIDMLLVNAAISFTVQLDILIAGAFFSKQVFGSFSQPRDLGMKIMTAINPVITRVGLPLMARAQGDPRRVGEIYMKVIRMTSSVCFPVYAALGIATHDVLPRLLGARWAPAAALMPYIAAWFAIRSSVNPLGTYLSALGRSRLALYYQVAFALAVAVVAYATAHIGPAALALGMAGTYLFFLECSWATVLRPISAIGFREFHKQVYIPAFCAVVGTVVACLVRTVLPLPPLAATAGELAIGGTVFLAMSFMFNREGIDEILALVGQRVRPAAI